MVYSTMTQMEQRLLKAGGWTWGKTKHVMQLGQFLDPEEWTRFGKLKGMVEVIQLGTG